MRTFPLPSGTEHVLLVDDEETITDLLQTILTGLGYQVTVSSNSLEALALIERDPALFDLLITDMTMPHLTGLELAQKTLSIKPDLPIILCTGFSEQVDANGARAMGLREFLMKPFSVREVSAAIRRALAGK